VTETKGVNLSANNSNILKSSVLKPQLTNAQNAVYFKGTAQVKFNGNNRFVSRLDTADQIPSPRFLIQGPKTNFRQNNRCIKQLTKE